MPRPVRTAEHRRKLSIANKGRIPWNKGIKCPQTTGEKNGRWSGDTVGYQGVHSWMRRTLGQPSECENCGSVEAKRYEWANLSGEYRRDISDWARLCVLCHRLIDNTYIWRRG